jgi:hypothetical protein
MFAVLANKSSKDEAEAAVERLKSIKGNERLTFGVKQTSATRHEVRLLDITGVSQPTIDSLSMIACEKTPRPKPAPVVPAPAPKQA